MSTSARPRLVILSLAPIRRDARVLRQVDHGVASYDVTVVAWGAPGDVRSEAAFSPVEPVVLPASVRLAQAARLALGRIAPEMFERWYWRKPDHHQALAAVIAARPTLIHANEAIALPMAVRAAAATGARLVFDAHEYSLDQFKDHRTLRALAAPLYRYLLVRYAPRADAMLTVGDAIADRYRRELGRPCDVVLNAPPYQAIAHRPVNPDRIRLIHHGVALRGRHLERTVQAVAATSARFTLELMLVPGTPGHIEELQGLAGRVAPGRVAFRAPVPPFEIVSAISDCDVGLALIPAVDFNYTHALPNKLFEYLMAGLSVAVGPSPEMARLVRRHGCGIVADDFDPTTLARALNALSAADIDAQKRRALDAARQYNAESELARLGEIYRRVLADGDGIVRRAGDETGRSAGDETVRRASNEPGRSAGDGTVRRAGNETGRSAGDGVGPQADSGPTSP